MFCMWLMAEQMAKGSAKALSTPAVRARIEGQGADVVAAGPAESHAFLEAEITRLKRERNAVVLAHYYQDSDIQDVADFLGGSKTTLIGNLIQRQFLSARDWPFGSAASVTLTIVMGLMIGLYLLAAKRANAKVEV